MNNSVLIIDNEKKTREALKQNLELWIENLDVILSDDGKTALKLVEKGKFELIILDLKLPGLSGYEVLQQIRKIDPYVEVIIYTNYLEPLVMKKLFSLGVIEYVNKGFEADLWGLVETVKNTLDPFTEDEINSLLESIPKDVFCRKN